MKQTENQTILTRHAFSFKLLSTLITQGRVLLTMLHKNQTSLKFDA